MCPYVLTQLQLPISPLLLRLELDLARLPPLRMAPSRLALAALLPPVLPRRARLSTLARQMPWKWAPLLFSLVSVSLLPPCKRVEQP